MGALSFSYSVLPNPKVASKFFEYRKYSRSIEYRLKYERYAALSDTSIFNAPVAVTKVATGVRLYDLFVDKKEKDTAYFKGYQSIYSVHPVCFASSNIFMNRIISPSIYDHVVFNINDIYNYVPDSFEISNRQEIVPTYFSLSVINKSMIIPSYMPGLSEINRPNDSSTILNEMDVVITHSDNTIHENHQYTFMPPNWTTDTIEFIMDRIPDNDNIVNLISHSIINRRKDNTVNLIPHFIINRKHDNATSLVPHFIVNRNPRYIDAVMNLSYRIERTKAGWEIYYHDTVNRMHYGDMSIFPNISAWIYDYRDTNVYTNIFANKESFYHANIYENINIYRKVPEIPYPYRQILATPSLKEVTISFLVSNAFPRHKGLYREPEILLGAPNIKEIISSDSILSLTPKHKGLNRFGNSLNASIADKFTNSTDYNIHGTLYRELSSIEHDFNGSKDTYHSNYIKDASTSKDKSGISIHFEDRNISKNSPGFSVFENNSVDKILYGQGIFSKVYGANRGHEGFLGIIFDPYDGNSTIDGKHLPCFQDILSSYQPNKEAILNNIANLKQTDNSRILNYFQTVSGFPKQKLAFEEQGYQAKIENKIVCELSLADFTIKENQYAIVIDGVSAKPLNKDLSYFHNVWTYSHGKIISELTNSINSFGIPSSKNTSENIFNSSKNEKAGIHELEQDENAQKDRNGLSYYQSVSLTIEGKKLNVNHESFTINNGKELNIKDEVFAISNGKELAYPPIDIMAYKDRLSLYKHEDDFTYLNRKSLSVYSYDIYSGSSVIKHLLAYGDSSLAYKDRIIGTIWPEQLLGIKDRHGFTIHDDDIAKKERYSFTIFDQNNLADKIRKSFVINDTSMQIYKTRKSFVIDNLSTQIYKIRKSFIIDDTSTQIYKVRKGVIPGISEPWSIYKIPHDMTITNWGEVIHKIRHDMIIPIWGENIYKDRKGISMYNIEELKKEKHEISPDINFEGAIKSFYPVAVSHYLKYPNWESFGGFIIPVSKVRHQAFIDYVNDMAKKKFRDVMVTEGDFGTVLARPTMLNFDISIDKLPKKAFIDYINDMVVKTKLKAFIEDGIFEVKSPHKLYIQYYSPWGYLASKRLQIEEGVFGSKTLTNAFIYSGEWTSKSAKKTIIQQGEFSFKDGLKSWVFADEWLDKLPYLCYYSYDTWGAKKENKAFISQQEFAVGKIKEVYVGEQLFSETKNKNVMLSFGDFAEKNISNAWYEECIFSDRLIRSTDIFQQIDWAFKDVHKCDLHPDDFGNWAWVYESPDPFPYDKYGIDELLLPEKDTRYENFEDLVFDKEHMRPRNAIKEISDTQWIAKLPIRHPIGKYEDVGKVYEDSAIKWENYFGIQTSVIHSMFLRYYRIWEKNMFKFSTMTMQQAGNLMLEYIWSWIPDYYPLEDIEQAYRAFRLIRWYTECAIINNSQYIISYEYANLAWPDADHKGICHIPSDLQEYDPTDLVNNSNDTMYSDTTPGRLCLKNNPIYTGSNDVWVTFRIKNKRNTTISLSLYNQSGSVNIYLNDRLIDVVSVHGSQKLAYNIQYTGSVNEFKIEKKAADNIDNNFIIGHISIANQSFKDLSIEFDPALRAGNKPLNEVAEKLIAFASLHDRKDIAYHEMLTKNLGVSEVYKLLLKYWQLHHENKWKGKRLTIKQV